MRFLTHAALLLITVIGLVLNLTALGGVVEPARMFAIIFAIVLGVVAIIAILGNYIIGSPKDH
jgi:hypothetical protein